MTALPPPPLSRRSMLASAAGTAALLATPNVGRAQSPALPPQQAPASGGRTAVIDVNRARTDPIPVAIPPFGGDQLGQDIATVVSNDLARSGLFRPIAS